MAERDQTQNNNVFSENDPLDINELAALDEEISNDFIEQLQQQISQNSHLKNDGDLFEEPKVDDSPKSFNKDIDDNFIKKYKAKLKKQQQNQAEEEKKKPEPVEQVPPPEEELDTDRLARSNPQVKEPEPEAATEAKPEPVPEQKPEPEPEVVPPVEAAAKVEDLPQEPAAVVVPEAPKENIENLTGGNIVEKPLTKENAEYNESLDYLDSNVKYSKYVIYIDPENKDFIDSLTVKERKNLINRIIHDQDSIAVTKIKFNKMQAIITHAIIAIMTITIAIPCIYWTINASLEATINNYRASQDVFVQLYKQNGKIRTNK